jgi:hypothetical protein
LGTLANHQTSPREGIPHQARRPGVSHPSVQFIFDRCPIRTRAYVIVCDHANNSELTRPVLILERFHDRSIIHRSMRCFNVAGEFQLQLDRLPELRFVAGGRSRWGSRGA